LTKDDYEQTVEPLLDDARRKDRAPTAVPLGQALA
jgi:hypothetical protein